MTSRLPVQVRGGACREKYAENASKLDSVLCLMDRFGKYHDVPKVATFRDMVELITRNLHQQIIREFQLLWIVSDPFAAHFSVNEGTSFEERSRVASQQEKVLYFSHNQIEVSVCACHACN